MSETDPIFFRGERIGTIWRKSRLAARLLLQAESRELSPRRAHLALLLSQDKSVSNRLIQHGLDWLKGEAARKTRYPRRALENVALTT